MVEFLIKLLLVARSKLKGSERKHIGHSSLSAPKSAARKKAESARPLRKETGSKSSAAQHPSVPALALSFSRAAASIYLGADVLNDNQGAGCVEHPRHIRLSLNGARNFGRTTCFFHIRYQTTTGARQCHARFAPRKVFASTNAKGRGLGIEVRLKHDWACRAE
jgi:hypothetical protein